MDARELPKDDNDPVNELSLQVKAIVECSQRDGWLEASDQVRQGNPATPLLFVCSLPKVA